MDGDGRKEHDFVVLKYPIGVLSCLSSQSHIPAGIQGNFSDDKEVIFRIDNSVLDIIVQ